jgi:hypothetical protein
MDSGWLAQMRALRAAPRRALAYADNPLDHASYARLEAATPTEHTDLFEQAISAASS